LTGPVYAGSTAGRRRRSTGALILGDHEGRAQIYDGRTFEPRGRPLLGHAGYLITADFSPDGRTVATSSSDARSRGDR
jgi:WD40 repeat protein